MSYTDRSTDIRGARVRYHRNGVAGIGFHTVGWSDAVDGRPFVAVVFDEPGACAVLDRSNPARCWRGDRYEASARAAIAAAGDDAYRMEPDDTETLAAFVGWCVAAEQESAEREIARQESGR